MPYLEHATMEPMNCTALVTDDRFEVWVPTQTPERAIKVAAEVPPDYQSRKASFTQPRLEEGLDVDWKLISSLKPFKSPRQ